MNRLTNKTELNVYKNIDNARYKLCLLENIEEDLGIDLIILFKALKNGFYTNFYTKNNHFSSSCYYTIDLEHKCIQVHDYDKHFSLDFKDYGKTWALTRKELK